MQHLVRVQNIEPLEKFTVRLLFEDGTQKEIDLEPYLYGPIFEPIKCDLEIFRLMKIDEGIITWDNVSYSW